MSDEYFDPDEDYGDEFINFAEPGVYLLQVGKADLGKSKSSGMPMITVDFFCLDPNRSKGARVRDWFVVSKKAFWKLKKLCKAVDPEMRGAKHGGIDPRNQASINKHLLQGVVSARIEIGTREYTNQHGETKTVPDPSIADMQHPNQDEFAEVLKWYSSLKPPLLPQATQSNDRNQSSEDFDDDRIPF